MLCKMEAVIPKIIHYCWFGPAEFSDKVKYCMKSWEKVLIDYKFILWTEDNFDFSQSAFARQAYENKKYAFVSDYVRIWALEKYGGIYLDTDIEVLKPFDDLLYEEAVFGTDDLGELTAFMASIPHHPIFKEILSLYDSMSFIKKDGSYNEVVNNKWMQEILYHRGYVQENRTQYLENAVIYPCEYFHAKSLLSGKEYVSSKTYCIHHHTLLWVSTYTRIIRFMRLHVLIPIMGEKLYMKIAKKLR